MIDCELEKFYSVILSATCHSLRNFPHSYTSPHIHSWIFETLWLFFAVSVVFTRLNVNWKKNLLYNFICYLSFHKKVSPINTHPLISNYQFLKPYNLIISWVWVICKRLNVNWKKIHSIILCITSHGLRNFPPLIHIASYPFVNFRNPVIDFFLSLNHS